MFSTKEFQSWAKDNVIAFASVMTRIEGRPGDDLLKTYGFRGFPSMALLNDEGEAQTKRLPRDLYGMNNVVTYLPKYKEMKAKVDAGEKVDETTWLIAQLGAGKMSASDAKEKAAEMKLNAQQKKFVDDMVLVNEMSKLARNSRTKEGQATAQEKVYAAFMDGKRLPAGSAPQNFFAGMLVKAAMDKKNPKAFFFGYERANKNMVDGIASMEKRFASLDQARKRFADNEEMLSRIDGAEKQFKSVIATMKADLAKMEAAAKELKGATKEAAEAEAKKQ